MKPPLEICFVEFGFGEKRLCEISSSSSSSLRHKFYSFFCDFCHKLALAFITHLLLGDTVNRMMMLSGSASFSSSQSSQCFNGSTPLKWKKKASLLTGYNKSKHAHTRSTRSYALIKLPSLSSFSVSKKTPPPPPPLDVAAGLRAAAPFAVPWASLVAYAALVAPTSPAGFDENLVQQIIAQQGPPTFSGLFNVMGVWPAVYASLLVSLAPTIHTQQTTKQSTLLTTR